MSLFVCAAVVWGAAWTSAPKAASAKDGGTLRVDIDSIDFLDPALAYYQPVLTMEYATAMKLFDYPDREGRPGTRLVPEAAAAMPRVSNDGRTYTFVLRKGLRFNTGKELTAGNFAAAINRVLQPKMNSPGALFSGDIVGAREVIDGSAARASGVKVLSRYRLQITLNQAAGDFVARLATPWFTAVQVKLPADPKGVLPPIPSAGPYYVASFEPNESFVLERNPYYRGPRPHHFRRMVFTQRGFAWDDERARVDSGSSDVSFVPRDRAAEVKAAYGVAKGRFFARRDLLVRWVYFNPGSSVFKDNPKLREAVNYALDRPALVRAFGGKLAGVVTDQLYPAEMAGFRDQKVYPVEGPNFAKARALANGRTRGGVVSMWAPGTPERQRAAEILVANLKQIGLDVRFALPYSCPPRPYCGPDIGIGGWYPDYPDPYQVIVAPFTDGVYGFLHNTPLKSQIASASRLRGEARIRAFSALENAVLQSQAPAAPFMVANAFALVSPRIGCFTYNEVYRVDYAALCLK